MYELINPQSDELVLKLIRYFIKEKNYNPIVIKGVDGEVWLENMMEDYKIVRIVSHYIHNDEQFKVDIFRMQYVIKQIKKTLTELKKLHNAFLDKAKEFEDVIKLGRTHLQEAMPIKLGQVFKSFASILNRDMKKLELSITYLSEVNIGATAIGTSINANEKYLKKI